MDLLRLYPKVVSGSAVYATANKNMSALVTVKDFNQGCSVSIKHQPAKNNIDGGYVQVLVNGLPVSVGDGKKDKACFFSRDGIVAAKSKDITALMYMYWVGSIAGYELKRTDRIDFIYLHI